MLGVCVKIGSRLDGNLKVSFYIFPTKSGISAENSRLPHFSVKSAKRDFFQTLTEYKHLEKNAWKAIGNLVKAMKSQK